MAVIFGPKAKHSYKEEKTKKLVDLKKKKKKKTFKLPSGACALLTSDVT